MFCKIHYYVSYKAVAHYTMEERLAININDDDDDVNMILKTK